MNVHPPNSEEPFVLSLCVKFTLNSHRRPVPVQRFEILDLQEMGNREGAHTGGGRPLFLSDSIINYFLFFCIGVGGWEGWSQ